MNDTINIMTDVIIMNSKSGAAAGAVPAGRDPAPSLSYVLSEFTPNSFLLPS